MPRHFQAKAGSRQGLGRAKNNTRPHLIDLDSIFKISLFTLTTCAWWKWSIPALIPPSSRPHILTSFFSLFFPLFPPPPARPLSHLLLRSTFSLTLSLNSFTNGSFHQGKYLFLAIWRRSPITITAPSRPNPWVYFLDFRLLISHTALLLEIIQGFCKFIIFSSHLYFPREG